MMRPFPSLASFFTEKRSPLVRFSISLFIVTAAFLVASVLVYSFVFGPEEADAFGTVEFIVHPDDTFVDVADALRAQGLVKHEWGFKIAAMMTRKGEHVREGGYLVSRSMDAFTVVQTLSQAPYLAWVEVPGSARKEQVLAALTSALHWDKKDVAAWESARKVAPEFDEGVYFADTYLIPSDLPPQAVADLLRTRFLEQTASYMTQAEADGKDWGEVLTFASLVEREAAKNDKALIAGILQNRLTKGMKLQVDATMQYVTGNEEEGWWAAPHPDDKYEDSPYNTYIYEGLPPAPIATPSVDSIAAVLEPEKTSCLYYLHDARGRIHCSPTYAQHLQNIDIYLR